MAAPNVIVFLTDDQGYGDLSCMGATDFKTPHLDRLAGGGARFTSWYANSSVCSPTRASLLTGRYPGNAGVRSILAGHRTATGLPSHVPTLAAALKERGYNTYMSGKWHLGVNEASRPHRHGFDHWYGFLAGCIDYYSHIYYWGMNRPGPGINPVHDLWEDNRERRQDGEYFTEAVTEQAIAYLRHARRENKPFFLYVAYNAPHYPMHAPEKYMNRFAGLPWDRQIMAAMLSAMDDGVGAIMDEVERQGVADRTLTFFMADNGPSRESRNWLDGTLDPYYGGTTGALKGHKGSLFEGGIRVPGIVHWPQRVPAGRVFDAPCAGMDIFPTVLAAAGGNPGDYELDGVNLLPAVCDGQAFPEREIFWELRDQLAVRRGKWKLVLHGKLVEQEPPADEMFLSDLEADPGEERNLAALHADIAGDLKARAETWKAALEERWQREFDPEQQGITTHRPG